MPGAQALGKLKQEDQEFETKKKSNLIFSTLFYLKNIYSIAQKHQNKGSKTRQKRRFLSTMQQ
jgi:hypothetical protein